MLKISTKGFRVEGQWSYEFPLGKSIRITGPNGAGKSNIYDAIRWVVYGGETSIHVPQYPSAKVLGKLKIDDIEITRNTSQVKVVTSTGTTIVGKDAETYIKNVFYTKSIWNICCHFTSSSLAFLSATATKRVEMLNELVNNDPDRKKDIVEEIASYKDEMLNARKKHDCAIAAYEALYESTLPDPNQIISPEKLSSMGREIASLESDIAETVASLGIKSSLMGKLDHVSKTIESTKVYTDDYVNDLASHHKLTVEYDLAKTRLKAFEHQRLLDFKPTAEELEIALSLEPKVERMKRMCNTLGIDYNSSITKYLTMLQKCSASETMAREWDEYVKIKKASGAASVDEAKKQLAECKKKLCFYDRYYSSIHAITEYRERQEKMSHIQEAKRKLGVEDLESFVVEQTRLHANQHIFDQIASFEERYLSYYNTTPDRNTYEEIIRRDVKEYKDKLLHISQSRDVLMCPHCDGKVTIQGKSLAKYNGTYISNVNVRELQTRLDAIKSLLHMPYPEKPDWLIPTNVTKRSLDLARDALRRQSEISSAQEDVPDEDLLECNYSIVEVKRLLSNVKLSIDKHEKYISASVPPEPKKYEMLPHSAKRLLEKCHGLEWIEPPKYSSSLLKTTMEYFAAKEDFDSLTKPVNFVRDDQMKKAKTNNSLLNQATKDHNLYTNEIACLSCSEELLEEQKSALKNLKSKVRASNKNRIMSEKHALTEKLGSQYATARDSLDCSIRYRDIYDQSCRVAIDDIVKTISSNANYILKTLESGISVYLVNDVGIKFDCIVDGVRRGSLKTLSSGQRTLVSFALVVAFSLESPINVLIMDEITDMLDPDNKDACIEILLQLMKANNKTVLVTDHHCKSGDFDVIIEM